MIKIKNKNKKPIILIILDGFGFRKEEYFNGVLASKMPNYFKYWNEFPHTKLNASGPLVGLPEGQIGSSEVGHLTLGAGRLIKQPIVRINEDIKSNKFKENKYLKSSKLYINRKNSNIHLMGLLGDGGVHSSQSHLNAIIDFYDKEINFNKSDKTEIFIHCFLDGRDTEQKSAKKYLKELELKINSLKNPTRFKIATLCGRYYAMDRDLRWDRTEKAYKLITKNIGKKFSNYNSALDYYYSKNITDEFIEPITLESKKINKNDLIIFFNFRSDRARQLTRSIIEDEFSEFNTNKEIKKIKFITLTDYLIKEIPKNRIKVLYETIYPKNTLGEIISNEGLTQLRIAESEKFPHVTYFFSGLRTKEFKGETRKKIDSPKIATYDLKPEMSAEEVTTTLLNELETNNYDFILLNFANSDMVGHTGNFEAVKKALNKVDSCLGKIKNKIDSLNGTMIITADHGNCETMKDEKGNPHTKHTYNRVPFILCSKNFELNQDFENISLFNVAPTILELMNLNKKNSKFKLEKSLIIKKN